MAKLFVPFSPTPQQPFGFSATFDGQQYQVTCPWNIFGLRWYVQCVGQGNVMIFNLPLIGSPDSGDINILAGYFLTSTLVFRISTQTFEIGP